MELKTDQNLKKHFVVSIVVALSIILSIVAATFAWYVANDRATANVGQITAGGYGDETIEGSGDTFTLSNPPFAKLVDNNEDGIIDKWQVKSPLGLVDYSDGNDETLLDTPAYTNSYELGLIYSGEIENETEHTFTIKVTKTITQEDTTLGDFTQYLEYALVSSDGTIRFSSYQEDENGVSICSFTGTQVDIEKNTIEYHEVLTLYVWFDTDSEAEGAKLQNFELNLHVDFVEATE